MSGLPSNPARTFALISAVAVAAVAAALVSQHVFDMQPCPWCVLQRVVFVAIALVALLGVLRPRGAGRKAAAVSVSLFAACGVAAGLWQHFVAAASASCNLTLADKIISGLGLDAMAPDVFAPRASCADAAVNLLGVPYEFWSMALFAALGAVALAAGFGNRSRYR